MIQFIENKIVEDCSSTITSVEIFEAFKERYKMYYGPTKITYSEVLFNMLSKYYADKPHIVRSNCTWKGLRLVDEFEGIDI
jgi:hypothetical protein